MDEEDLADAEESRKIQTQASFSGLGTTADDATRMSGLMGLLRVEGETMGTKLLRRMGWKDGQGIGPKVLRQARLELNSDTTGVGKTYLFAPENVPMISFVRKVDHKGLGYAGDTRLTPSSLLPATTTEADDSEEDDGDRDMRSLGRPAFTLATGRKKERDKSRGGIGVGILNDTGSDEEDPYEMGPRISYNRVIGGDKRKMKATTSINPALKTKPTYIPSRKSVLGKVALGVRKCHDGRLPLEGFVFGREPDVLTSEVSAEGKYPPPEIPPGWVSAKQPRLEEGAAGYVSTAETAKASTLDPKARAAILGEKQLPGKSVFDFMSAEARERLVSVTGRTNLPPARGEVPAGHALSEADRLQELLSRVPKLDRETAVAAISRGAGGNAPYADDETKRARYISFLEYQAGFKATPGSQPPKLNSEEWLRELQEFYNCARIFKPMTGFMASRFTTSTTTRAANGAADDASARALLSKPPPKQQDPAEEAAKLGMFGAMTRSVADFYPTRLLCKRFNVKPPEHVQPDEYPAAGQSKPKYDVPSQYGNYPDQGPVREAPLGIEMGSISAAAIGAPRGRDDSKASAAPLVAEKVVVDASTNQALEGQRAGEEVFRAIFGDSDDEA